MKEDNKMKHIIRLFILIAALVLGTDHAWASAQSNPRVKFVYESEHGSAFASAIDSQTGLVTITVTPVGDYRCKAGDLTAEQSVNSSQAEARRRNSGSGESLGKGVPVDVTCVETNKFTLALPADETMNVTVYVKFSEKGTFTPTVSITNWTYGDDAKTPTITDNPSNGDVTCTYADTEGGSYNTTPPTQAGPHWVKATVAATADYKACESEPFEFRINHKLITIASMNVSDKVYDGTTAATLSNTFSFEDGLIVGDDDVSIDFSGASAEFADANAGSDKAVTVTGLALTGADMNNYDLTNPYFTTAGSITKKDLTITANDHTIDYGEEPDNGGVTYDGFVNGENENTSNIFGGSTLTYAYNEQADESGAPYTTSSPVGKYYIIPSGLTSNNYNISFQPGTLTVNQKATISVIWDDDNNVGGLRPGSLEFKLLANGSDADPECKVTLNEENNWTITVDGLTPYNGETLIPYTWSLETPTDIVYNDYELGDAPQSTSTTGATARFTYIRKTGSLTVRNTVNSDLATDFDKAFTYTVKLTNSTISGTYGDMEFTDGEATITLTGQTDNNINTKTATGLLYGTTYTVTQTAKEGFITSPKVEDLLIATGTIGAPQSQATFTNTRQTGDLTVTNTVYSSDNDTDFEFTVALTNAPITGTYGDMMFENGIATVTLKGGGSAEATGLPTTVEYTVTQTANDDFSTTKTGDTGTISATQSVAAFKNIKLIEARFDIDWHDGGNTSSRPEGLTTELLSKLTTDEGEPQPVPEQGAITLNEGNNWHASVPNLPMYNEDGTEIAYSWREIESVPSGYLPTYYLTDTQDASYTYTQKTSATVTIEWDDANNQDGIRPTGMTATLSDGSEYNNTVTLNSTNSWTATVEDLPKYKVDDNEITYTWTQDGTLPEGYASTNPSIDGIVTTITNRHTPEVTEVKVSKVWDDENNAEGFRPDNITVKLMANGEQAGTVTLNEDNEWEYTFTGLNKYEDGEEIDYTVEEDQLANYSTQITKATDGTFTYTVTNSRSVEKTEVSVQVVWDDKNNEMGFRPESVTVKLLVNGVEDDTKTATLNLASEWKYTWTELNKFANGQEIEYTISQDQVNGYMSPTIAKDSESAFSYTVTNKFISVSGVTLTKDASGITLTLTNTGEETVSIPTSIEVDHVVIDRVFEANKAATVYLPFSFAVSKVSGGKFHTFTTVDETKDPWEVQYTEVTSGDIAANTPYIFMPDGTKSGKIVVDNESKVSVSTANPQTTTQGLWEFIGTYKRIKWTHDDTDPEYDSDREAEIGSVYGFAANDIGSDHVGDFVKVGNNVWINPTRAYLKRTSSSGSRTREIAEQLPDKMKVVLISANGESMEIGTISLDYETGDWYSIDGRKLNGKPTKKGLYINNGKKVVIKN